MWPHCELLWHSWMTCFFRSHCMHGMALFGCPLLRCCEWHGWFQGLSNAVFLLSKWNVLSTVTPENFGVPNALSFNVSALEFYNSNFTVDLPILCTWIEDFPLDLFLSMWQAAEKQAVFCHLPAFVCLESDSSAVSQLLNWAEWLLLWQ